MLLLAQRTSSSLPFDRTAEPGQLHEEAVVVALGGHGGPGHGGVGVDIAAERYVNRPFNSTANFTNITQRISKRPKNYPSWPPGASNLVLQRHVVAGKREAASGRDRAISPSRPRHLDRAISSPAADTLCKNIKLHNRLGFVKMINALELEIQAFAARLIVTTRSSAVII